MELIGNLNLQEREGNAQNLYSSQLYGTFFSIYTLVEAEPLVGNTYTLKSMKLKIMNYKGVVDLGITRATLIKQNDEFENPFAALILEVQAMHQMSDEFLTVDNAEGFEITKGSKLQVERFLKPMHDKPSTAEEAALSGGVFDSELYYREGKFEASAAKRNEHIGRMWPKMVKNGSTQELQYQIPAQAAGGWLCPFAWLFII